MSENHSNLVTRVWNYAHVLRRQGIPFGDYIEQITYLLFLKMDEEREEMLGEGSSIPDIYRWHCLKGLDGDDLETRYRHALEELGKQKGLIGQIFNGAQNKVSDAAKLKRLVSLIDGQEWLPLGVDVKGVIYEGLLERNAQEVKSGAGQYFTPRPLIQATVDVMRPQIGMTICDPACGTGGFLLAAFDYMRRQSDDKALQKKLKTGTFTGYDIVPDVVRLAAMNMYLHGIGENESPIVELDVLATDPGNRWDMVLTNPPFGRQGAFAITDGEGKITRERDSYERDDFIASTSNNQLNFLQHIMTILGRHGRAAVVLPDNVLFEAGAGEKIRRRLLERFDLHTMLRLPTGIFYSQGVKANVLFFDKKLPGGEDKSLAGAEPATTTLWIYDFRTNQRFTLKQNPLKREQLDDFVACFRAGERQNREETERFRPFAYGELIKRDRLNLDIFWLKDESLEDTSNLPPPEIIAAEIVENLEAALKQFREVALALGSEDVALRSEQTSLESD
jgi:type I restriction enzyme M protein